MVHNTDKEKWIDGVIGSMAGAKHAQPAGDLHGRVMARLHASAAPPPVKRWAIAAAVLVMLNVGSVLYYSLHRGSTYTQSQDPLSGQFQSVTTYNY